MGLRMNLFGRLFVEIIGQICHYVAPTDTVTSGTHERLFSIRSILPDLFQGLNCRPKDADVFRGHYYSRKTLE